MTNKFELWVTIGAKRRSGELYGQLTANKLEYDPVEINHGRVTSGLHNTVGEVLSNATERFQQLGYEVPYTRYPNNEWVWEQHYGDGGMFKRTAIMGEPETQEELVINGKTYRLVEE